MNLQKRLSLYASSAGPETSWWEGFPFPNYAKPHKPSDYLIESAIASLFNRCINMGKTVYKMALNGYLSKQGDFSKLSSVLVGAGGKRLFSQSSSGNPDNSQLEDTYVWGNGIVNMSCYLDNLSMFADVYSDNPEWTDQLGSSLSRLLLKTPPPSTRNGRVYLLGMTDHGPRFFSTKGASFPMEVGNYNTDVMDQIQTVTQDLNSPSPAGRLTIIQGPPGSGKTFLVRGLMDSVDGAMFIFVPPNMVKKLGEPSLVSGLLDLGETKDTGPSIFILEDADECLMRRGKDNTSSVSSLLNLTEGILGEVLDIRAVATSNLDEVDIDPAIKRKGRLSQHIHVGELEPKQASQVFKRLTGDRWFPDEPIMLSDVYSLARQSGWVPESRKPKVDSTDMIRPGDLPGPDEVMEPIRRFLRKASTVRVVDITERPLQHRLLLASLTEK